MARTNQTKLSNPADMLSKIVSVQSCGRSFFTSDYKRLYLAYSLMCSLGTFLDGNPMCFLLIPNLGSIFSLQTTLVVGVCC